MQCLPARYQSYRHTARPRHRLPERPVPESRWPDLLFRRHLLPRDLGLRLRHGHGNVANRRIFASYAAANLRGLPDGATVDAEGFVWSTSVYEGKLVRFAPDGTLDRTVENATSVIFGGPNPDIAYVTSMAQRREGSPPTRAGIWGAVRGLRARRPWHSGAALPGLMSSWANPVWNSLACRGALEPRRGRFWSDRWWLRVPVWREPENLDLCPGARGSAGRVAGMHGLMAAQGFDSVR